MKMSDVKIMEIYEYYCSDGMRKLKRICDPKISRFCGNSNMDKDDLYSISLEVLMDTVRQYDDELGKFEVLLSGNIQRKIYTFIRDTKYRSKRSNVKRDAEGKLIHIPDLPIDLLADDGIDLAEKLDSGFRIEDVVLQEIGISSGSKMDKYLERLSKKQRKVVVFLSEGYSPLEIREILHMTEKEYADCMMAIRAYRNTKILL